MNTNEKLDKLYELEAESGNINAKFDELKHAIPVPEIPREIQDQLDQVEIQRTSALNQLQLDIENLRGEIKDDVLKIGSTVKGQFSMAVYNKGRISWNSKGLEGYMVAHPEIASFRSEGDPSVTIRKI